MQVTKWVLLSTGLIGAMVLAVVLVDRWLNWRKRGIEEAGARIGLTPLAEGGRSGTQPDPFAVLIDRLARDGLTDEASRLNVILCQTAWTTGTEFLGAFGLEMKSMRRSDRRRATHETKAAFRSAAKVVKKCWPRIFWP